MHRLDRETMLMEIAKLVARRGTCSRAQVGAVLAREGRILSTGYAGSPRGMPHCIDVGCEEGPDGGCIRTIHAEANAIIWAARHGISTEGTDLYCTHGPCLNCAKMIANAGIHRLFFETYYRDPRGMDFLAQMGVQQITRNG